MYLLRNFQIKEVFMINWRRFISLRVYLIGVLAIIFITVVFFMFSGCATIFKGNSNIVEFSSQPQHADVYVNGFLKGHTPINLKLESKKTYNIEFKKEGYETQTFTLTNSVGAGWVVLDVVFGLVPVVIDAATGCWYGLDQDAINAILEKQQTP
jgi:hypothetical protein